MALALEADMASSLAPGLGITIGRCESCRQPGRVLTVLVDELDGKRFEVCDSCL